MHLSSPVEWALHCVSVLATLPEGRSLSTRALAEFHGVPKEYLSKALQALSTAGLVTGSLGPSGGYRLARPPAKITFLEVVEAVEGRASSFACTEIRRNIPCRTGPPATRPCAIARVMWQADRAWRDSLASVTMADLGATLSRDLPPAQIAAAADWIAQRS